MADKPGTDVAPFDEDLMVGLEDFDTEDMVMPRITVLSKEALFKDSLSGVKYDTLDCVVLGLVRQRVLWEPEMPDTPAPPLCKSVDHEHGHANTKSFPWESTSFDPANYDEEDPVLECAACPLKEWGSNPKSETPWCTEQYTLVILMPIPGPAKWAPAVISLQRAGLKSIKAYLSSFKRSGEPLFVVRTTIELEAKKRGNVDYATPVFTREASTDEALWPGWANTYRTIRTMLTTWSTGAPTPGDGDAVVVGADGKAKEAPTAEAEDVPDAVVVDDEPF